MTTISVGRLVMLPEDVGLAKLDPVTLTKENAEELRRLLKETLKTNLQTITEKFQANLQIVYR